MKYSRKTALALLSVCILSALVACGEESTANPGTDGLQSAAEAETVITESTDPALPVGLDFGGREIHLLEYENLYTGKTSGDVEGGLVSDAMYDRNLKVSELLNVSIVPEEFAFADIGKKLNEAVMADDDSYDIVANVAQNSTAALLNGYYRPISELKYIDLSQPWWFSDYIESVSLKKENACILFGDISYGCTDRVVCTFFNKRVLADLKDMTDEDLYKAVFDGEWTLDYFTELCRDVYNDTNGNGVVDDTDIYALGTDSSAVGKIAYSVGLTFTDRDAEGYPVLNMNNERSIALGEKMLALYSDRRVHTYENSQVCIPKFAEGKVIFMVERFFAASWQQIRDMTDDFGILPVPKYDESIDTYHSVTGPLVVWGGVPITAADPEPISAVCEAMAFYGKRDMFPVYFETALKVKYSRDDRTSQMLDLIKENSRTDFLYLNDLSGIGNIYSTIVTKKENVFSSEYAKRETAAMAKLEEMIENDRNRE